MCLLYTGITQIPLLNTVTESFKVLEINVNEFKDGNDVLGSNVGKGRYGRHEGQEGHEGHEEPNIQIIP